MVPSQFPAHLPTPIAFIGEAPGDDEVLEGTPLVGPSGKVFNAMLRTANLRREDYLVGNVFSEKAPNNDCTGFMHNEIMVKQEFSRLADELAIVKPSVIVPLGGTALWAFTGHTNIMDYRGAVMPANRIVPGAKLVPTLHPEFIIHTWKLFTVVAGDFIKAAGEAAKGPAITYPTRRLILRPTIEEVEAYVKPCLKANLLSVDIETAWGQITCIGFALTAEEAMCVPFVDILNVNHSYWPDVATETRAWLAVKRILEGSAPKLGQNFAGYDWLWLLEKVGIGVRNLQEDTRLLHHALYPELPKSLSFMGASYTQQGPWKVWGHKTMEKKDD